MTNTKTLEPLFTLALCAGVDALLAAAEAALLTSDFALALERVLQAETVLRLAMEAREPGAVTPLFTRNKRLELLCQRATALAEAV